MEKAAKPSLVQEDTLVISWNMDYLTVIMYAILQVNSLYHDPSVGDIKLTISVVRIALLHSSVSIYHIIRITSLLTIPPFHSHKHNVLLDTVTHYCP